MLAMMEENTRSNASSHVNETIRLKNIAESRQILAELGLLKSWQVHSNNTLDDNCNRVKCEDDTTMSFDSYEQEKKSTNKFGRRKKLLRHSPRLQMDCERSYQERRRNFFGHIPGIPVGTIWATRLECCIAGVHRYPVAGIHGSPLEGCYSIALSGGYEDDLDLGDCFTYSGEGGRSAKVNNPSVMRVTPQIKDMSMSKGNLALTRNIKTRRPVRVIRGFNLQSPYAPLLGYRYDGLYFVEKYWECIGSSGFRTIKFALRRCENQAPPPWISKIMAAPDSGYNSPESTSDCVPSFDLPLADEELNISEMDCQAADIDIDVDCDLEPLNLNSGVIKLAGTLMKRKTRSRPKAVRRRRQHQRKTKLYHRRHSYALRRSSTESVI